LVQNPLVLALSAGGKVLNQEMCTILSSYEGDIVLLCGHYEGMDDRIFDHVDLEVSVGDYVLSGGELGAAVIMETVIRLLPGFVEKSDNVRKESFTNNLWKNLSLLDLGSTKEKKCQRCSLADITSVLSFGRKSSELRELWCKDQIC